MKKFLAMALTGAMCVGLLAGCSNGSSGTTSAPSGGSSASTPASSTAGADGAIKIGGIGPLTGSAATDVYKRQHLCSQRPCRRGPGDQR